MNLNIIEACKKVDEYIKELPEDFKQHMWELFNDMKEVSLEREEYIETLDEPLKSTMKSSLDAALMVCRIREACSYRKVCDDEDVEDITAVLSQEYLCMNQSPFAKDLMRILPYDEKENPLEGLYENFKEIYEKNVDKIAACRDELGLPNPFSDFKPYSLPSE